MGFEPTTFRTSTCSACYFDQLGHLDFCQLWLHYILLVTYIFHSPDKNVMKKLTMKRKRTVIFAPYDAQSSVEILLDKMATILVVLNAFIV